MAVNINKSFFYEIEMWNEALINITWRLNVTESFNIAIGARYINMLFYEEIYYDYIQIIFSMNTWIQQ